jgi:hypothetical protein
VLTARDGARSAHNIGDSSALAKSLTHVRSRMTASPEDSGLIPTSHLRRCCGLMDLPLRVWLDASNR